MEVIKISSGREIKVPTSGLGRMAGAERPAPSLKRLKNNFLVSPIWRSYRLGKGVSMKKAIFLGVSKLHSNKKNADYRKVDFFTPQFKDERGFTCGVQSVFTALDSTLGNDIEVGAIVIPEFEYNPYLQRADLIGIEKVQNSPYDKKDFE